MRKAVFTCLTVAPLALSCQPYQTNPVTPTTAKTQHVVVLEATQLAPNVMFVVDRSASMNDAAGAGQTESKLADLQQVMVGSGQFIENVATQAAVGSDAVRVGLVTFSGSMNGSTVADDCSTGMLQVPLTATSDPSDPVAQITGVINGLTASGGTPTAASMMIAAEAFNGHTQLDRPNYIVLLTDGAPDCNGGFADGPSACLDNGSGQCVDAESCYTASGQPETMGFPPYGCLDESNLVKTVAAIDQAGVQTFVIGFGDDVSDPTSLAYQTLDRSAAAGGQPQGTEPLFYSALSSGDLQNALTAILAKIQNKCDYTLATPPTDASTVEVLITDASGNVTTLSEANGDYSVDSTTGTVTINGAYCTEIKDATAAQPLKVTFDALEQ